MLGQAVSLINRLMTGRITGAPWWRTVRKGLIIKNPEGSVKGTQRGLIQTYKQYTKNFNWNQSLKAGASYFVTPSKAFADAYNRLIAKTPLLEDAMFFMYNPSQWTRTTKSGYEEIKIPGGKSVFHQASTPPQTFTLELLLDNSLWNNSDTMLEALADHAVGAFSRSFGAADGSVGDMGLREAQFYHYPTDTLDPFFSKPGMGQYASLAPIIYWYETLCRPDAKTLKCPEVTVVYQDMLVRCIVESCTTTILKSDWRQNINRASLSLNFIVLENLNLDAGVIGSEKDLLSAVVPT